MSNFGWFALFRPYKYTPLFPSIILFYMQSHISITNDYKTAAWKRFFFFGKSNNLLNVILYSDFSHRLITLSCISYIEHLYFFNETVRPPASLLYIRNAELRNAHRWCGMAEGARDAIYRSSRCWILHGAGFLIPRPRLCELACCTSHRQL